MLPRALADRVKRMIEVNDDTATLKGVYFNPAFTQILDQKVPDLRAAGIILQQTNTEAPTGQVIEGNVQSSNGMSLSLGSVILDGQDLAVGSKLATIDTLISFVGNNAKQTV